MQALSLSVSPLSRIASADGYISPRPELPTERLDLSDQDSEEWEDNILSDDSDASMLPKFADSFRRKLGAYTCRANTPKLWTAKTQLDFAHQEVESGTQAESARYSETSPTEMSSRSTPRKDDIDFDPLIKQSPSIPTLDEVLEEEELELLREQQEMMNKEVQIMAELQLAKERQEEHRKKMEEEQMALMRAEQIAMINFLHLQDVKSKSQQARPTSAPAKSRSAPTAGQRRPDGSQLNPRDCVIDVQGHKNTPIRPQTATTRPPEVVNHQPPAKYLARPQTALVRPQTAPVTVQPAETRPSTAMVRKEPAQRRPQTAGACREDRQKQARSTFSMLNPFRVLRRRFSIHPSLSRRREGSESLLIE